jgi:protein-disulfide isomerase
MPFTPVRILISVILFIFLSVPAQAGDSSVGHILGGSIDSPIRIEVFSNFQCPACSALFLETIQPILKEYSSRDKVFIVYHEFPLTYYPNSREAARYSEAAARMGLSTLLPLMESFYRYQADWGGSGNLAATAAKALPAADLEELQRILKDPRINDAVERQYRFGLQKNIGATPTMVISSPGREQEVRGAVSYQVMKRFIDSILK